MPKQALLNGTIEDANDFDGFNELDLLKLALEKNSWTISEIRTERAGYNFIKISSDVKELSLHIYLKKVNWRHRSEFEKGIQFPGDHITTGYEVVQSSTEMTVMLGIYKRSIFDDYLICAWLPNEWGNRGKPFNCFIDVNALAEAFQIGFSTDKTKTTRNVFAFRPEFIHYYLLNRDRLHQVSITNSTAVVNTNSELPLQHQVIFYGSPGTGKSREVENRTLNQNRTRTTFHPETDYHSFVGSYKPVMEGKEIKYEFVPQAFTNAYCNAWLNPDQPYFLIIEEINRGNCAQIFGDIFQCLDRDDNGQSKYDIHCDKDLALHLKNTFTSAVNQDAVEKYKAIINTEDFDKLILPSNLFIYATMNTSDQSLFPMDSAFKRRWDWEFIPINYADANLLTINIDDTTTYNWGKFIEEINPKIKELTGSEDKQLGNRFISPADGNISFEQFRSKVLFYLWSEVYKDEVGSQNSIFKYKVSENEPKDFQFGELFTNTIDGKTPQDLVKAFMDFNGIPNN